MVYDSYIEAKCEEAAIYSKNVTMELELFDQPLYQYTQHI